MSHLPDDPPTSSFELKVIFLRELADGYREAREAQEGLLHENRRAAALGTLHDFFHRIAGFAARVDLHLLGHLAAVCERALARATPSDAPVDGPFVRMVAEGLDGVAYVLDQHGTGPTERPLPRQSRIEALAVPDSLGEGRQLSKILVVDDDVFSAALIDHTLRTAGFMSSFVHSGEQAMHRIEEELPDLIVMDVMMPEMDGFELCRRVRSHPALQFTPIIFVTRKGDVEQRIRGLEVGANDYVAKPFEPAELVARVRSHLQRLSLLREMAIRDGLTRCFNHRFFKLRLDQEMARAKRYDQPLSVAMIDIDHFKRINDELGHATGDHVLSHLADVIHASVRSTDVVARYGGEEFAVLMVHAGAAESTIVGNRIRQRVEGHPFVPGDAVATSGAIQRLTVSIGLTEMALDDTPASFLERADQAMYDAKRGGRNNLRVAAA
jgi:diguanylate cyclase (GGDEF)-like protein